jgi:hypothetical protein
MTLQKRKRLNKLSVLEGRWNIKQARKGFRPLSAIKGIGFFQNLGNVLAFWGEFLGSSLGVLWEFFVEFFGNWQ